MLSVSSTSSLDILNWMLHVQYTRKNFNLCRKLTEKELKRSNTYNEYANYILARIYQEEGNIDKSLEHFTNSHKLNPSNIENVIRIGHCHLFLNEERFLLGRVELAAETFKQAEQLAENPDWNIYYYLGICDLRSKKEETAEEYLKRALELDRNEKSFLELARLYEKRKKLANAADVYSSGLRLYPASTDLSVNLGLIFMKAEEYRKAFDQLGNAIAHDQVNPYALFTFAAEIQRHGEYDVAILKYKIAAQKLPECAEMWNNIGMCFFGKRKYVAAITCLKRSYYLNPMNWLTCYNLGLLHLNIRQYTSAALFLSTAIKLNPQHASTFTLLALSLKHLGDDLNCRKCFEEALNRNEYDVEACVNYALFFYTVNETVSAAKHCSDFQRILNNTSMTIKVDKELMRMAELLADALQMPNKNEKNAITDYKCEEEEQRNKIEKVKAEAEAEKPTTSKHIDDLNELNIDTVASNVA